MSAINFFTKSGRRKTVRAWRPEGTEHQHQVALFQWAAMNEKKYPELALMFAVPNAARRSPRQGAWMKAEGLMAGVPDICLPVSRGKYHGLYIEMKKPNITKTGKVSMAKKTTSNQDGWHEKLREHGNRVEVCYGADAAINVIEKYLAGVEW